MDATRERLLDAAGQTFAARGFDGASVREICAAADANVAAINYHFGDKQRLYIETVKHAHCRIDVAAEPLPPDFSPEQCLRAFVEHMTRAMHEDRGPEWGVELVMREMARPSGACQELVEGFIRPKFAVLLGIIDGLVPAEMSDKRRHLLAFGVVGQILLFRFQRPVGRLLVGDAEFLGYRSAELAEQVFRFSLAGIRAAAEAAS